MRKYRRYTKEEADFVRANYQRMSYEEIGNAIGRTKDSVGEWLSRNNCKKNTIFTKSQKRYMESYHGRLSISEIAINLGTPRTAVERYCYSHLGAVKDSDGNLTLTEVSRITGASVNSIKETWQKYGLKTKKIGAFRMIREDELLRFMEEHPERWKASKCEEWYFSDKKWFQKKRKEEFDSNVEKRWGKWKENCQN